MVYFLLQFEQFNLYFNLEEIYYYHLNYDNFLLIRYYFL